MDKSSFPNPRLQLPGKFRNNDNSKSCFDAIDNYLDAIAPYIFTEINLKHEIRTHEQVRCWVLRSVSESLLRSLYIRNIFVDSINNRNLAGAYLALKAWIEIVGFLASILEMLQGRLPAEELHKKLTPLLLGNKGKGKLRVGEIEAKSVITLLEAANKYISKLHEGVDGTKIDTFFTDYYDVVSNPSHPSFDAHEMIGRIDDAGVWRAFKPEKYSEEVFEQLPAYGGLLMSAMFIRDICGKIFAIEGLNFRELGTPYFSD